MCVASGYAYAGVIDSDVCYDEYGIPYIPAKRLKGIMLEAAKLVDLSKSKDGELSEAYQKLFGNGGDAQIGGFFIENAYLEQRDELVKQWSKLLDAVQENAEEKELFGRQNLLQQFTTEKAQTRIGENGVADDRSLRFTRTINHYWPFSIDESSGDTELCFVAKISYYEEEEKDTTNRCEGEKEDTTEQYLIKIAKAVRNIGLNRNRGLGSVVCTYISEPHKEEQKETSYNGGDTASVIRYKVRNTAPLMLSGEKNNVTETYISGTSVIGFLAGEYRKHLKDEDVDETFERLFVNNAVTFSNLYPFENGIAYYPAPFYLNKLKKSQDVVNVICLVEKDENNKEMTDNGNQPKKLKGKYIGYDSEGKLHVHEVEKEVVYHHSRTVVRNSPKEDPEETGILYAQEVVKEGQEFWGEIYGKYGDLEKIRDLLNDAKTLRFGKSKTAQYGTCELTEHVKVETKEEKSVPFQEGEHVIVTLQSDGIFLNEENYTVRCNEVQEQIKQFLLGEKEETCLSEELNVSGQTDTEENTKCYTELEAKQITGRYTKWNLKKQAIPAIVAGSSFAYRVQKTFSLKCRKPLREPLYMLCMPIGEKTGEGYGMLSITKLDLNSGYIVSKKQQERGKEENQQSELDQNQVGNVFAVMKENSAISWQLCKNILEKEIKEEIRILAYQEYKGQTSKKIEMNPAALGRLTLMLTECINQYPDVEQRYDQFCKRIATIKKDKTRQDAANLVEEFICSTTQIKKAKDTDIQQWKTEPNQQPVYTLGNVKYANAAKGEGDSATNSRRKILYDLYGCLDSQSEKKQSEQTETQKEQFDAILRNEWSNYLFEILTVMKYENSKKKRQDKNQNDRKEGTGDAN